MDIYIDRGFEAIGEWVSLTLSDHKDKDKVRHISLNGIDAAL